MGASTPEGDDPLELRLTLHGAGDVPVELHARPAVLAPTDTELCSTTGTRWNGSERSS